jgi:hypothetical protein
MLYPGNIDKRFAHCSQPALVSKLERKIRNSFDCRLCHVCANIITRFHDHFREAIHVHVRIDLLLSGTACEPRAGGILTDSRVSEFQRTDYSSSSVAELSAIYGADAWAVTSSFLIQRGTKALVTS